jgi:superfamily II DNA or RNA helicase
MNPQPNANSAPPPKFQRGDQVRVCSERDRLGVIWQDARRLGQEYWYAVLFGAERQTLPECNLEAYQAERDPDSLLAEGMFGNRETFAKCVTFRKLQRGRPLGNALYSFRATRTQFYPHQFKPLVKFLDSPRHRLLVADEVGLGKTIEAGYILRELKARGPVRRVLVVCPSALCRKWQDELQRRFDEDFAVLNAQGFREFLARIDRKGDRAELRGICSLQTLRNRTLLKTLEAAAPPLDLVIIDEAHHLRNRNTLSNWLGRVLNDLATGMVLLTATPIHLGNENLFNLLRILDPKEFDRYDLFEQRLRANEAILEAERALRRTADLCLCKAELRKVEQTAERRRFLGNPVYDSLLDKLDRYDASRHDHLIDVQQDLAQLNVLAHILTRSRKREVQVKRPKRSPRVVPVNFTIDEREFYAGVTQECSRWYQRHSGDWAACFAAIALQRQMASCIPAFLAHCLDPARQAELDALSDEMSELAYEDWAQSADELSTPDTTLRQDPAFQRVLHRYRHLQQQDTKYEELDEALRELEKAEPGRKLIIFSYFKKTLAYLERRLSQDGYTCVVITGDIPANPSDPEGDERSKRLRAFRDDPKVRILLSSEVGSEGLDFQFCSVLVNYDLPWNPMVVEQRIGRLDRLGQDADRIVIVNFSVRGTIEERILDRLYHRIRIFEGSIGDLEPILGEEIKKLTEALLQSRLTPEEQEARIAEVAAVLERRRQDAERLEQESGRFLGHDEFFNEQIARILSLKRYLTADELRVFIADFLDSEHPRCTLKPAREKGCFWLTITAELADLVRRSVPGHEPEVFEFLGRAHSGGLLVTFDSDAAYETPHADLINSQHPLTRTVVRFYEDNPDRTHPVAKLKVRSAHAAPADYLYYLNQIEVHGIKPGRFLEAVFVPVDTAVPLSPNASEQLLVDMLTRGETLPEHLHMPGDLLRELKEAADAELARRLAERKDELLRVNGALVRNRFASLTASYEAKRGKHEELLRREEGGQAREHYLRMLRGGLRNIEAEYDRARRQREEDEKVDVRFLSFAAGVVRVEEPPNTKEPTSHARTEKHRAPSPAPH